MTFSLGRKLAAEGLGAMLLLAIVIGSGVMGETLADGNDAIALLGNTVATGAGLVVLIGIFGPISGGHFNPAVTFAFLLRREITLPHAAAYGAVQIIGGIAGAFLAHLMFDLDILQVSTKARAGLGQATGELVAAFGLVLTIHATLRFSPKNVAAAVGLFITAGYWFTSSTSFANPAVTLARMLTDTFAGIRPADAPSFIIAQMIGAALAVVLASWLLETSDARAAAGYRPDDEAGAKTAI